MKTGHTDETNKTNKMYKGSDEVEDGAQKTNKHRGYTINRSHFESHNRRTRHLGYIAIKREPIKERGVLKIHANRGVTDN